MTNSAKLIEQVMNGADPSQLLAEGDVSWHIPAEVEEIFRKAYLRLHKMKSEFDKMEDIPSDLRPVYDKVLSLADKAQSAIQDTAQVTGLVRKVMQHYR